MGEGTLIRSHNLVLDLGSRFGLLRNDKLGGSFIANEIVQDRCRGRGLRDDFLVKETCSTSRDGGILAETDVGGSLR